jgi:hypothetical protein
MKDFILGFLSGVAFTVLGVFCLIQLFFYILGGGARP